jgi:predicted HTH transcriptional regulator
LKAQTGPSNRAVRAPCAQSCTPPADWLMACAAPALAQQTPQQLKTDESAAAQQVVPRPFIKVDLQRHEGERVVVAKVLPFGAGTLCTLGGIVYYRHGSAVTKLEGKTLQDYLVTRYILDFGEQLSSAGMDDVNAEKLRSFLSVRSPEIVFDKTKVRSYLDDLGVTTMVDGGPRLKNVGVLFFGTEPSRFIMQAEIRIARFRGTTPVDIIDAQYITATIPEALKAAEDFVKRNTRVAFVIEGMRRKEVPEYPEKVVREVLVNALAHRDYFSRDSVQVRIFDDRLEVINPGKLPMELNVHDLGTMSVQRNPHIYRLLRDLGLSAASLPFIQAFGGRASRVFCRGAERAASSAVKPGNRAVRSAICASCDVQRSASRYSRKTGLSCAGSRTAAARSTSATTL